jgi:hypothetical protein
VANDSWLRDIADRAMRDLFAGYDVALQERQGQGRGSLQYSSAICFISEPVKASVILAMGEASLRASMPPGIDEPIDWIGELGNQLLGRAVNLLCAYGVHGRMGTPVVLPGALIAPDGDVWQLMRFEVAESAVVAAFVWTVDPNYVPAEILEDVMSEGDSILF